MSRTATVLLSGLLLSGCVDLPYGGDESATGPSKDELAADMNEGTADFSIDWCEHKGWYGDGECDWFCLERDPDCNVEPLFEEPTGAASSYPIVLAHGFMANPTNFWSFHGVPEALERDGHRVFEAEVPAFSSSEVRALELAAEIDAALEATGADKVHLIAHSMGGLDARIVASPGGLDYGVRLASVTTIGTAHGGTALADAYLGLIPGFADRAFDAVTEFLGDVALNTEEADSNLRAAMESLGGIAHPDVLGRNGLSDDFRSAYPDAAGLSYQSWAGVSTVLGRSQDVRAACDDKVFIHDGTANATHALLWGAAAIATFDDGPTDGMIAVESTKHGEFRGCVPADHLDLVGQISNDTRNDDTGFDHITWYRTIVFELAARE